MTDRQKAKLKRLRQDVRKALRFQRAADRMDRRATRHIDAAWARLHEANTRLEQYEKKLAVPVNRIKAGKPAWRTR